VHDDPYRAPAEREIGELALVAGVNPGRAMSAGRARSVAGLRPDPERHQIHVLLDAVHRSRGELRQKRINVL
jgi:hypothetical protein